MVVLFSNTDDNVGTRYIDEIDVAVGEELGIELDTKPDLEFNVDIWKKAIPAGPGLIAKTRLAL